MSPFIKGQPPPKKGEKLTKPNETYGLELAEMAEVVVVDQERAAWESIHESAMKMSEVERIDYLRPMSAFYYSGIRRGWANHDS